MNTQYHSQSNNGQSLTLNRIVLGLGILLAALLLCWLTGGFPPTTWRLFFQTLTQLGSLARTQGAAIIFPFMIVIFQSLALGAAWGLLVWLAAREGWAAFTELQGGGSQSYTPPTATQLQQPTPNFPPTSIPTASPNLQHSFHYLPGQAASQHDPQMSSLLADIHRFSTSKSQPNSFYDILDNPFEEDENFSNTSTSPLPSPTGPFSNDDDNIGSNSLAPSPDQLDNPFAEDEFESPFGPPPPPENEFDRLFASPFQEEDEDMQPPTTSPLSGLAADDADSIDKNSLASTPSLDQLEDIFVEDEPERLFTLPIQEEEAEGPSARDSWLDAPDPTSGEMTPAPSPAINAFRVHAITHPGLQRAYKPNEDSYAVATITRRPPFQPPQTAGLFLVADGVGGHDDGKYASSLVVDVVRSEIERALIDPQKTGDDLQIYFAGVIQQANALLYQKNKAAGVTRGTTLTGAVILEQPSGTTPNMPSFVAHIINVGDSRTYHYSPSQGFRRVTRDHSTVELLVARGEITPEERYTDKRRNQIYRCLGTDIIAEVDEFTISLHQGDKLLLCSDGLWEMVPDTKLEALLLTPDSDPDQITFHLLQAALEGGGHDNITAITVLIP